MSLKKNRILLFDVDGTLTPSRQRISKEMAEFLKILKKNWTLGFVGGSDMAKIDSQLGESKDLFEYQFSENGVYSIRYI